MELVLATALKTLKAQIITMPMEATTDE